MIRVPGSDRTSGPAAHQFCSAAESSVISVRKPFKLPRNPRGAAMQQIVVWLEKLGLGQYGQPFAENDIDYEVLCDTHHSLAPNVSVGVKGGDLSREPINPRTACRSPVFSDDDETPQRSETPGWATCGPLHSNHSITSSAVASSDGGTLMPS